MHGLAFNSIHQQSKSMFLILLEDVWSQENKLWITDHESPDNVWFLKSNWCFIEQLTLVFDSPKLCFLLLILPALHLWLNRAKAHSGLLILFRFVYFAGILRMLVFAFKSRVQENKQDIVSHWSEYTPSIFLIVLIFFYVTTLKKLYLWLQCKVVSVQLV